MFKQKETNKTHTHTHEWNKTKLRGMTYCSNRKKPIKHTHRHEWNKTKLRGMTYCSHRKKIIKHTHKHEWNKTNVNISICQTHALIHVPKILKSSLIQLTWLSGSSASHKMNQKLVCWSGFFPSMSLTHDVSAGK